MLGARWTEAEALGRDALSLAAQAGDPMAPWLVRSQSENALETRGRHPDIDRDWLSAEAAKSDEPWAWRAYLAHTDVVTGRRASARRMLETLTANRGALLPDGVNWHATCDVAEAIAELGDRDAAALVHARLAPHVRLSP